MKNLLILFITILTLASCGESTNEFIITGKLENAATGNIIFLSKPTKTGVETIDSTLIGDDGKFELKGNTSYPDFYLLRTKPNENVVVLADSADRLTVTGDFADFMNTNKISGSKDIELLNKVSEKIKDTKLQIDSLKQVVTQINNLEMSDSVLADLDKEFKEILLSQKEFSKKIIDENANSMVSFFVLTQQVEANTPVFAKEDLKYFEKVHKNLNERYPQSEYVKVLFSWIDQMKNPQPNQPQAHRTTFNIGDKVPDIVLKNTQGQSKSLSELKGNYVLLDFWAAWCSPCRAESPNLVDNYKKYNKKGFDIFQVSLDKDPSAWIEAIEKDGLKGWTHVRDAQSVNASAYGIVSIPTNFLIDKDGKIVAMNLRGPQLAAKLQELFGF